MSDLHLLEKPHLHTRAAKDQQYKKLKYCRPYDSIVSDYFNLHESESPIKGLLVWVLCELIFVHFFVSKATDPSDKYSHCNGSITPNEAESLTMLWLNYFHHF